MAVFLDGQIVPEERAVVSVFDRSFLYGDGLFETVRVLHGKPFRWAQHLERLERGAQFLGIRVPFSREQLQQALGELVSRNQMADAVLRLTLSRGIGPRGFSPKGAERPLMVMSLHPVVTHDPGAPRRWHLVTATHRVSADDPLAQFKTCNKLPQILARAQADRAGADEALLLNGNGLVAEAASGNVFWVEGETVCTPPAATGILPGVTRAAVLELCPRLDLRTAERSLGADQLRQMPGVFLTLSSLGVVEVGSIDGEKLHRAPVLDRIRAAYQSVLEQETRAEL